MATTLKLDPELQAVVERARAQARERGELLDGPGAPPSQGLSPAARAALADWVSSGDYDRAVAEIVAGDPDLQIQVAASSVRGARPRRPSPDRSPRG